MDIPLTLGVYDRATRSTTRKPPTISDTNFLSIGDNRESSETRFKELFSENTPEKYKTNAFLGDLGFSLEKSMCLFRSFFHWDKGVSH